MRLNRRSIYLTKSEQQGGKLPCCIPERTKCFVRLRPAAQEGLCNVAPGKIWFFLSIPHKPLSLLLIVLTLLSSNMQKKKEQDRQEEEESIASLLLWHPYHSFSLICILTSPWFTKLTQHSFLSSCLTGRYFNIVYQLLSPFLLLTSEFFLTLCLLGSSVSPRIH